MDPWIHWPIVLFFLIALSGAQLGSADQLEVEAFFIFGGNIVDKYADGQYHVGLNKGLGQRYQISKETKSASGDFARIEGIFLNKGVVMITITKGARTIKTLQGNVNMDMIRRGHFQTVRMDCESSLGLFYVLVFPSICPYLDRFKIMPGMTREFKMTKIFRREFTSVNEQQKPAKLRVRAELVGLQAGDELKDAADVARDELARLQARDELKDAADVEDFSVWPLSYVGEGYDDIDTVSLYVRLGLTEQKLLFAVALRGEGYPVGLTKPWDLRIPKSAQLKIVASDQKEDPVRERKTPCETAWFTMDAENTVRTDNGFKFVVLSSQVPSEGVKNSAKLIGSLFPEKMGVEKYNRDEVLNEFLSTTVRFDDIYKTHKDDYVAVEMAVKHKSILYPAVVAVETAAQNSSIHQPFMFLRKDDKETKVSLSSDKGFKCKGDIRNPDAAEATGRSLSTCVQATFSTKSFTYAVRKVSDLFGGQDTVEFVLPLRRQISFGVDMDSDERIATWWDYKSGSHWRLYPVKAEVWRHGVRVQTISSDDPDLVKLRGKPGDEVGMMLCDLDAIQNCVVDCEIHMSYAFGKLSSSMLLMKRGTVLDLNVLRLPGGNNVQLDVRSRGLEATFFDNQDNVNDIGTTFKVTLFSNTRRPSNDGPAQKIALEPYSTVIQTSNMSNLGTEVYGQIVATFQKEDLEVEEELRYLRNTTDLLLDEFEVRNLNENVVSYRCDAQPVLIGTYEKEEGVIILETVRLAFQPSQTKMPKIRINGNVHELVEKQTDNQHTWHIPPGVAPVSIGTRLQLELLRNGAEDASRRQVMVLFLSKAIVESMVFEGGDSYNADASLKDSKVAIPITSTLYIAAKTVSENSSSDPGGTALPSSDAEGTALGTSGFLPALNFKTDSEKTCKIVSNDDVFLKDSDSESALKTVSAVFLYAKNMEGKYAKGLHSLAFNSGRNQRFPINAEKTATGKFDPGNIERVSLTGGKVTVNVINDVDMVVDSFAGEVNTEQLGEFFYSLIKIVRGGVPSTAGTNNASNESTNESANESTNDKKQSTIFLAVALPISDWTNKRKKFSGPSARKLLSGVLGRDWENPGTSEWDSKMALAIKALEFQRKETSDTSVWLFGAHPRVQKTDIPFLYLKFKENKMGMILNAHAEERPSKLNFQAGPWRVKVDDDYKFKIVINPDIGVVPDLDFMGTTYLNGERQYPDFFRNDQFVFNRGLVLAGWKNAKPKIIQFMEFVIANDIPIEDLLKTIQTKDMKTAWLTYTNFVLFSDFVSTTSLTPEYSASVTSTKTIKKNEVVEPSKNEKNTQKNLEDNDSRSFLLPRNEEFQLSFGSGERICDGWTAPDSDIEGRSEVRCGNQQMQFKFTSIKKLFERPNNIEIVIPMRTSLVGNFGIYSIARRAAYQNFRPVELHALFVTEAEVWRQGVRVMQETTTSAEDSIIHVQEGDEVVFVSASIRMERMFENRWFGTVEKNQLLMGRRMSLDLDIFKNKNEKHIRVACELRGHPPAVTWTSKKLVDPKVALYFYQGGKKVKESEVWDLQLDLKWDTMSFEADENEKIVVEAWEKHSDDVWTNRRFLGASSFTVPNDDDKQVRVRLPLKPVIEGAYVSGKDGDDKLAIVKFTKIKHLLSHFHRDIDPNALNSEHIQLKIAIVEINGVTFQPDDLDVEGNLNIDCQIEVGGTLVVHIRRVSSSEPEGGTIDYLEVKLTENFINNRDLIEIPIVPSFAVETRPGFESDSRLAGAGAGPRDEGVQREHLKVEREAVGKDGEESGDGLTGMQYFFAILLCGSLSTLVLAAACGFIYHLVNKRTRGRIFKQMSGDNMDTIIEMRAELCSSTLPKKFTGHFGGEVSLLGTDDEDDDNGGFMVEVKTTSAFVGPEVTNPSSSLATTSSCTGSKNSSSLASFSQHSLTFLEHD